MRNALGINNNNVILGDHTERYNRLNWRVETSDQILF